MIIIRITARYIILYIDIQAYRIEIGIIINIIVYKSFRRYTFSVGNNIRYRDDNTFGRIDYIFLYE